MAKENMNKKRIIELTLILVIGLGGILLSYYYFVKIPAKIKRNQTRCKANLRCVGFGITMYFDETGDIPKDINKLVPDYLPDNYILHCPASKEEISYEYLKPKNIEESNSNAIAVFDKKPYHNGGRCVAYIDCHAAYLKEEEFQEELKRMLKTPEYRKQYTEEAIKIMEKYLEEERK